MLRLLISFLSAVVGLLIFARSCNCPPCLTISEMRFVICLLSLEDEELEKLVTFGTFTRLTLMAVYLVLGFRVDTGG